MAAAKILKEIQKSKLFINKAWIGGEWIAGGGRKTFPIFNPATREVITEVRTETC